MKFIKVTILVSVIAVMVTFSVLYYQITQFRKIETQCVVELNKGEGLSLLAQKLENNGIIYDSKLFKLHALILGFDKSLKPGEYELSSKLSHSQILQKIISGKILYRKITIPEGLNIKEIKHVLENNEYLIGDISVDLKEGYLLPETYYFRKGDSRNSILEQMHNAFNGALDLAWEKRNRNKLDRYIKTKDDLVNLASIVEKEALLKNEKPIIAAVYLNRLKYGMRLQADPTVIYGAKNYNGDITYKMLREKTDYNTYVIFGLPKTPIANPGLDSLLAVANPDNVKYLYFVADGKGGHTFSTNYQQHRKNVKEFLKKQKEESE